MKKYVHPSSLIKPTYYIYIRTCNTESQNYQIPIIKKTTGIFPSSSHNSMPPPLTSPWPHKDKVQDGISILKHHLQCTRWGLEETNTSASHIIWFIIKGPDGSPYFNFKLCNRLVLKKYC